MSSLKWPFIPGVADESTINPSSSRVFAESLSKPQFPHLKLLIVLNLGTFLMNSFLLALKNFFFVLKSKNLALVKSYSSFVSFCSARSPFGWM